eukprot:Anaeramoba_ignava/a608319_35.p2 GENE.a608319_35~~a608319_35.p2  ORF type:complete len:252 (+),score=35.40 a608319_35:360-1115(+)
MEKLKPNELGPTLTLAKLYESQNQIIDALVTYKKLYFTKPEDETQQKISELQKMLVNSGEVGEPVKSIFTDKEIVDFMILSKGKYIEYQEALESDMPLSEFPEELDVQENEIPEEPVVGNDTKPVKPEVVSKIAESVDAVESADDEDVLAELEGNEETSLDIAKLLSQPETEESTNDEKPKENIVFKTGKVKSDTIVEHSAMPLISNLLSGMLHCQIGEVSEKMIKHFGKNKKIGEISIFELLGFIQDLRN